MKRPHAVSFWYTVILLIFLISPLTRATDTPGVPPSGPTSTVTTGYADGNGNQAQGAATGAATNPAGVPRYLPLTATTTTPPTYRAYPNISNELVLRAKDPKDTTNALQLLQTLNAFGKKSTDTLYSDHSGWERVDPADPDAAGYLYKPPENLESLKPVNNNFTKACDMKNPALPVNIDGMVEKLRGHTCNPQDDRLTCMVCNLYHEARGEPEEGQLAVVQNVMTRVFFDGYPDTVCKVVWMRKGKYAAYSWTNDHRSNTMDYNDTRLRKLIEISAKGMCLGPNGYINYYNPHDANPSWGANGSEGAGCKATAKKIGNHLFCNADLGGAMAPQTRSVKQVRAAEGLPSGLTFRGGGPATDSPATQ